MSDQSELQYGVIIYRKDGEHILIDVGNDFEKCRELHSKLDTQWEECHKEATPFRMVDPEVTSFEPGLIKEIKIVAGPKSSMNEMGHNPYVQRMKQQGFSASFKGQTRPDLISSIGMYDEGYKF